MTNQALPQPGGSRPGCGPPPYAFVCATDFRRGQFQGAVFERQVFSADLTGADLSGATFKLGLVSSALPGARMVGARLDGVALSDLDLTGADLSGASANGTSLSLMRIDGARFGGASLNRAVVSSFPLMGDPAELPGPGWRWVPLVAGAAGLLAGPNLYICPSITRFAPWGSTIDLRAADLSNTVWRYDAIPFPFTTPGPHVPGTVQPSVPACGAQGLSPATDYGGKRWIFDGANLQGADMGQIRQTGNVGPLSLSFVGANLSGAKLEDGDLWNTDFSRADLTGVTFRGSRFGGTRPQYGAGGVGTVFTGTIISGTDFSGTSWTGKVVCADGRERFSEPC